MVGDHSIEFNQPILPNRTVRTIVPHARMAHYRALGEND
jgi:hypothetical protein